MTKDLILMTKYFTIMTFSLNNKTEYLICLTNKLKQLTKCLISSTFCQQP